MSNSVSYHSISRDDERIDRIKKWMNGEKSTPWHMQLQPTQKCNLICRFCWRNTYSRPEELPDKKWKEITKEAGELGVHEITIVGGGEPLMRPQLVMDMIKIIKKHDINGCLLTNGTLITENISKSLIKNNWNTVAISIHGASEKTDDFLRGKDTFRKTIKSIDVLNRQKLKFNSENPILLFHSLITRQNLHEIEKMVELAIEKNVRVIVFRLVNDDSENPSFYPTKNQISFFEEQIEKSKQLTKNHGIDLQLQFSLEDVKKLICKDKKLDEIRMESISKKADKKINISCARPFSELVIIPDGTSSPCCLFCEGKFSEVAKKTKIFDFLDNIKEKKLKDIWFGSKLEKFRDMAFRNEVPPYCKVACTLDYSYLEKSEEIYHKN